MSETNMEKYLELLEKYDCRLVNGVVLNSNDTDTKILWKGIVETEQALQFVKASNEEEARKDLLNMFENLLKERAEV